MKRWIESVWYRSAPPPLWLRPLAAIYGAISRRIAEKRRATAVRLSVPVIVVGNVVVGGTGKTPVTLWLIEELKRLGHRPGVLSRGYGGRGPFPCEVDATSAPAKCGDEPVLIATRASVPVVVAPDRVAAGNFLLKQHAEIDVLVCDDGLQHYRLARDLEICVIDGARGFGNRRLLPAGPLREPASRAQQAGLILVNGGGVAAFGADAARFDLVLEQAVALAGGERRDLAAFKESPIHAVAGIGNPSRFFRALSDLGLNVIEHAFHDHHAFSAKDFSAFGDAAVLMTEKDAVKCRGFAQPSWWSVPAQLRPSTDAEAQLRTLLTKLFDAKS